MPDEAEAETYVHRAVLELGRLAAAKLKDKAQLAALLVERLRHYERNCRCPKCHAVESGPLPCVECDFCLANLRKLFLDDLTRTGSQPVGSPESSADFSCAAESRSVTFAAMKTKTRKSKTTAKAQAKAKPKSKLGKEKIGKATPRAQKKPATPKAKKGPVSINTGNGTIYDRQIFVRFDTPADKQLVQKHAESIGVSASAYAAHFALEAAKAGKKLPEKEKNDEAVAAAG